MAKFKLQFPILENIILGIFIFLAWIAVTFAFFKIPIIRCPFIKGGIYFILLPMVEYTVYGTTLVDIIFFGFLPEFERAWLIALAICCGIVIRYRSWFLHYFG